MKHFIRRRMPWMLLLTMLLMITGCSRVTGTANTADVKPMIPQICMEVQDYADTGYLLDITEIPVLVMPDGTQPNEGVDAVNQALTDLKEQYASSDYTQCILYPTETDRYINLLFYQTHFNTDLNTGHVYSLVYDKEQGQQVTAEDALALAGLTQQQLLDGLSEQYNPQLAEQIPDADIIVQNQALEGFRMDGDGKPVFYLTARTDDADDDLQDYVSGGEHLYVWADGQFAEYIQAPITADSDAVQPLVPTGETVKLNPPLWCEWYFAGGEPEGGFPAQDNTSEQPERQENAAPSSAASEENSASFAQSQETDQISTNFTAEEAYKAVLQGSMTFREINSGEVLGISQVGQAVTPDSSLNISPKYFSAVDLDADGRKEVILSLTINGEDGLENVCDYLVLRWQDDTVYGYPLAVRAFSDLREDGTFWTSGGASDVGICSISFDRDTYAVDRFTYSLYEPSDDSTVYFVNRQAADEETWNDAVEQWRQIPYAKWYPFTDDNINTVLR